MGQSKEFTASKPIRFPLFPRQHWLELERKTQLGPVAGFGKQAGDLLKAVLGGYDTEAAFFDESVRTEKRKGLFTSAVGVSMCGNSCAPVCLANEKSLLA